MSWRRIEERAFKALMMLSTALVVGSLLWIAAVVLWKGAGALKLSMLVQLPRGGAYGEEGGILNGIVGSMLLSLPATLMAGLVALPACIILQDEHAGRNPFIRTARLSLDVLWGIPSIVYGAFGYTLMVYLGLRASLLAGIIAITFVQLPIVARAIDEVMKAVPRELKEAAYATGATRFEVATRVVLRQCLPGILTGLLLGFGRGVGDAAALIFTAGYSDRIPGTLAEPVASLPLTVFYLLGTPYPEARARAYAAAFVLLVIVLIVSVVSRFVAVRFSRSIVS
jgi:phosphate transport system permease protein